VPDDPTSSAAEPEAASGYTSSGEPTFESVREKIEKRYTSSIGAAELDSESPEGRDIEDQYQTLAQAAAERLAQIRESMRDDTR
jgi:phage shock protein A